MGDSVSVRYFRTADASLYESVRIDLDRAWGHPNAVTATCISPAAESPRDSDGNILLAIDEEFATWEPAATLLPELLASGAVEEIASDEYTPVFDGGPGQP